MIDNEQAVPLKSVPQPTMYRRKREVSSVELNNGWYILVRARDHVKSINPLASQFLWELSIIVAVENAKGFKL